MTTQQLDLIPTTKPLEPPVTRHVKRTAMATYCAHCQAPLFVGLDNDTCALIARADPTPLTALAELTAILTLRATYNAIPTANGIELLHRDQWRLRSHPFPVWPEHLCHQPLGPVHLPTAEATRRLPDTPPF